jgi:3-oxoacyl-[acyl-carrier protein] reductase
MSDRLKNEVAIITGGGSGLGEAFALRFAEEGAKVFIPDINLGNAEKVVKAIEAKGGQAAAMKVDISNEDDVKKLADEVIKKFGKVDILVNNAAVWAAINPGPWDKWQTTDFDKIFRVNVTGTWLCCKYISPLMLKQKKGKIVNIASDVIKSPDAQYFLPYALSKSAVYLFTQALAGALSPSGINVNSIGPGYTATEAAKGQQGYSDLMPNVIQSQCIKRLSVAEDIVGTALFLASKDSDFVTGQCILVNGGHLMQ